MKRKLGLLLLLFFLMTAPLMAQQSLEPADIINDEGGPVLISGEGDYTFPSFGGFHYDPYIVLGDIAAFIVDGDTQFVPSDVSQVIGKVTSDPFVPPFTYQVSLPIEPLAELYDVDNNGTDDTGVMMFSVALNDNWLGDPFVERRDFYGLLNSVILSEEPENYLQVIGGTLMVYAPDDEQGFPSGFGDDGALFTEDDPIVLLPQGYTLVNMQQEPFTFDRSAEVFVELFEPELAEANDFTNLSYTEAFDAMIALFRTEYAFTEYKNLDWDALSDEFRPRVEDAEEAGDVDAFREVIRDFAWSIPDGHVGAPIVTADFQRATAGGLGMAIREVEDGRTIVNFITPGGPAEEAGIEIRAEILEIAGTPIDEHVSGTQAWSAPFSTPDFERLQQLRYAVRFPLEVGEVDVTYQNPGDDEPTTVTLPLSEENESFSFSSFNSGLSGTELPVEFEILDNGYGYIRIYSFADDKPLTYQLWERALDTMNVNNVPGIVLDMRQNNGGSAFLADQMPAYFFNEELNLGYTAVYKASVDDFFYDPDDPSEFILPPPERRYNGAVAVIVAPACQSACESFAFNMALQDRAAIVGHYPTSGLGGSVVPIFLPDGVRTSITNGRSLDADGEIHIEGIGVQPSVRVPVTEDTLFSEGDPLLEAAFTYLEDALNVPAVDAGSIEINQALEGELVQGERVRYLLQVPEGDADFVLDFIVTDETEELDTYLRVYIDGEDTPRLENDDDVERNTFNSALREVAVPAGITLVVEVGGFNDAEAGDFTLIVKETSVDLADVVDPDTVQPPGDDDDDSVTPPLPDDALGAAEAALEAAEDALRDAEAALEAAREALREAQEAQPQETPEPGSGSDA